MILDQVEDETNPGKVGSLRLRERMTNDGYSTNDAERDPPSLLTTGDRVRFVPIELEQFHAAVVPRS